MRKPARIRRQSLWKESNANFCIIRAALARGIISISLKRAGSRKFVVLFQRDFQNVVKSYLASGSTMEMLSLKVLDGKLNSGWYNFLGNYDCSRVYVSESNAPRKWNGGRIMLLQMSLIIILEGEKSIFR